MKKILPLIILLVFALALCLSSCGNTGDNGDGGGTGGGAGESAGGGSTGGGSGESGGGTGSGAGESAGGGSAGGESGEGGSTLLKFEGITFEGKTVTYDGNQQEITVSGSVPEGTSVTYTNNKATNAGSYNAIAKLEKEGYETKTLTANLVINKAVITAAVTLTDSTVEYDTQLHSIAIVGNIPAGTVVSYTYNGASVSGVSEVGKYTVVATVSGSNYTDMVLTATLTIKSTEELLYVVNHDGVIYFQNNLDDNKLYKIDNGRVVKVNNDKPEYFFSYGGGLYYYSASLFSKTIKHINSAGTASVVYSVSGEYITCDGTYIYYAVNNLLINTDENGIYRYKLDGSETEPTRIATTKAAYLTVYGSDIYYSNLSDGKKLYRVSTSGGTPTLLVDFKAEYIIEDNGVLYFDASNLTSSAIHKYVISESTDTKLTTDSGKYLTKAGNYIYYINNDLLTSTLFGDGIYKTSVLLGGSLPGSKVISAEEGDGYSSLTSDGEYLYYYKLSDKHLYRFDPDTEEEVDLMASFVPPVEEVSLVGDAVIAEYNGEIYYTNPRDGGLNGSCLYKYNPTTGTRVKVLADEVAGIWFSGDYMYYSTCIVTNYALNRMNMKTGEIEKINSDRCENLIFEGDDIYYIEVRATGNNKIMKMSATSPLDEPTELYSGKNVSVTGMYKSGDTFYFISNPTIGYQYLYTYTIGGNASGESLDIKAKHMALAGNKIYYYDGTSNSLKCCNLDGSSVTTVKTNVEINDMYVSDGTLYFASVSTANKGLYTCNTANNSCTKIYSGAADGVIVAQGKVWFVNTAVTYTADYPTHSGDGEGYLYCYNGSTAEKK